MPKGVKIAVGLQCRHSPARAALIDKIHDGEMGDISCIRAHDGHNEFATFIHCTKKVTPLAAYYCLPYFSINLVE